MNGGSPGLKTSKIENKVSMRIVQNCDIELENVFISADDRLPGANSFQDLVNVIDISSTYMHTQTYVKNSLVVHNR